MNRFFIALCFTFISSISFASRISQISALVPIENSDFGWSVATDGQTLVVGAPYENGSLGAAYVYTKNGLNWDYITKLVPNYSLVPNHKDVQASPYFGWSLDVDGSTIVIGAYRFDSQSIDNVGTVFVYEDVTHHWDVEPSVLTVNGEITQSIRFGTSVAIQGDTIVAGATFDNDEKGAVYIYERSGGNWSFTQKLQDDLGLHPKGSRVTGDRFGYSVEIDGDVIVAGAMNDEIDYNERQGSAYIFRKSGSNWAGSVSVTPIYDSAGAMNDFYGCSVDVSDDVVVVGAYGVNDNKGKVHVYRYNSSQWNHEVTLPQEPQYSTLYPDAKQDFGYDVAIDGDRIVTGASLLGYIFMFEWDGSSWSEANALVPDGGEGYLGRSVAIAGNVIFAGSPYKDGQLQDIGEVTAISLADKVFSEFQVNTYTNSEQRDADVACNADGEYIIVWSSYMQDSSESGIYGQKYNKYGIKIGNEFRVNQAVAGSQSNPKVAFCQNGCFVVVWTGQFNDYDIFIRKFDSDCNPLTNDIMVNDRKDSFQRSSAVAFSGSNLMVGWIDWIGTADYNGSYFTKIKTFDLSVNPLCSEKTISGPGGARPQIFSDGQGNFQVLWEETLDAEICTAYINKYSITGQELAAKKTLGMGREFSCSIYPSKDYVVLWEQENVSNRDASLVKAQKYSSSWVKNGPEMLITDLYMDKRGIESTLINGDNLAVTWSGKIAGSDFDIYLKVVDPNGITLQRETIVNSFTTGTQLSSIIATGSDGDYLVTWLSENQDGSANGVYAAIGPKTYFGDFDFSGQVDINDLSIFAGRWLTDEPVLDIAPEGGDRVVNSKDFNVIANNWLERRFD